MLPFLWTRIPNLHCKNNQGCFLPRKVCFFISCLAIGGEGQYQEFQSYHSPGLKTFSQKEKPYHQTFLKRKFNRRTRAVFTSEKKRGELCFFISCLDRRGRYRKPRRGFLIVSILPQSGFNRKIINILMLHLNCFNPTLVRV